MLRFLRNRLASAWGGRSVRRTIDHYEDAAVKPADGSLTQGRSMVGNDRNCSIENADVVGYSQENGLENGGGPRAAQPVLNLPSDINEIGRLNPQLREAMEAHDLYTK